jgi:hypothetical protein
MRGTSIVHPDGGLAARHGPPPGGFANSRTRWTKNPDRASALGQTKDSLGYVGVGPRRVAEFLQGGPDDEIQADVVGFVKALLDRCKP